MTAWDVPPRLALPAVAERAIAYLDSLATRHVGATASADELLRRLDRPLPEEGTPAARVLDELAEAVEPGLVASAGPRYFGFVAGGATPAALMADWMTSAWDQNAQVHATSPAAAAAEAVVARWIPELLGLPRGASVGLVTGCQMANFTALACARRAVLERTGWDLDRHGLFGAPPVTVLLSEAAHATVRSALQLLGFGTAQRREVEADAQGRLRHDALARALRELRGRPVIVSLQAGNVNTGAFEPFDAVADLVRGVNAWVHVDGAFGLWAAGSPTRRALLRGVDRADSWATDAHKWLNVPYDSGLVIVKDAAVHRRLKSRRCAYAGEPRGDRRDGSDFAPENSRRARAFVLYAVLREAGRAGIASLVDRCCDLARQFARDVGRAVPGARVLNDVVLNQVLVQVASPAEDRHDPAAFHEALAARLQADGACWIGGTTWRGEPALRVSICNAGTTAQDVAVAVDALARAVAGEVSERDAAGVAGSASREV